MKGMVFTEFLDMIESRYGVVVLENIVEKSHLPHKGAYTAIGTYDHAEMFRLIGSLSSYSGLDASEILIWFGQHLFKSFSKGYPLFFKDCSSSYPFLISIEYYIHREVRKLYPDAELPKFDTVQEGDQLTLIYQSERGMAALAEGLILGCIAHFKEQISLDKKDVSGNGTCVHFYLNRQPA